MGKIVILTLVIVIAAAGTPQADIYRLEGDDETIAFTDAPNDSHYRLIMREQSRGNQPGGKSRSSHSRSLTGDTEPSRSDEAAPVGKCLPIQGRITSTVGLRSDPFDGRLRHHQGMDIASPSGTPVKPVAPGTVLFSGWKSGYGNTVVIDHGDGMVTVYAHHARNLVSEGESVDGSTVIALTGSSGRSTGPHLHFEAWRNGSNITREFMPDAAHDQQPQIAARINRYLQPDGTIVFTNLR